jgi:hypothetical protein
MPPVYIFLRWVLTGRKMFCPMHHPPAPPQSISWSNRRVSVHHFLYQPLYKPCDNLLVGIIIYFVQAATYCAAGSLQNLEGRKKDLQGYPLFLPYALSLIPCTFLNDRHPHSVNCHLTTVNFPISSASPLSPGTCSWR